MDDTFKDVLLPIIRKTIPSLIAADIVGVQPMTGPSGLIFSMKHKYGRIMSAHKASAYDDWLQSNMMQDSAASVGIYIDELLDI